MSNKSDGILRFLKEDELSLWDALVEASPQGSVFCHSWWLKAVGGNVKVLGYFYKDRLIAGIPLFFKKRFFMTIITMPKLTQTWGVVLEPLSDKRVKASSKEMEILRVFARALAKYRIFIQCFNPNLQNWLPLYWNGFKQTSRVTYVFDDLTNLEDIWIGLRENIRTDIRKAKKKGITVKPCSLEVALSAFKKTFKRQGKNLPYSKEHLSRIYNEAKKRSAGECFAAEDTNGNVHAASFLVWDEKKAYYLVGGGDPDFRNSGGTSLLIWQMIQFSAERSKQFDFEGSSIESIERFFRAFGSKQISYNVIYKLPVLLEFLYIIQHKR